MCHCMPLDSSPISSITAWPWVVLQLVKVLSTAILQFGMRKESGLQVRVALHYTLFKARRC